MTAVPVVSGAVPLGLLARPAGGRARIRRAVLMAGGGWLAGANRRVGDHLRAVTGVTRSSGVLVQAIPPIEVVTVLADLAGVPASELVGAQLAAEADAADGRPKLWLFVASCRVLWHQQGPVDGRCLS